MHSIRNLIRISTEYLEKKGIQNGRREAEELLAALLNRKRIELYFDYDAPLEEREVEKYRDWIRRKGKHEPVQYIVGKIEFLRCTLKITPDVLIPRQETEIFTSMVIKEIPGCAKTLWDLCCGSGCIGLSIKKERPDLDVTLSDLSNLAVELTQKNAKDNHLLVKVKQGDLLDPFFNKKTDVVICNPPYITDKEYEELEDEVRLYEPKSALIGSLSFYERLSKDLPRYLNPGAKVFLEIGANQGELVYDLFHQKCWKQKRYENDWSGHNRFFFLEYQ